MNITDILLYINNSEYIRGWLRTICKDKSLRDDLFSHCLLQISNEKEERLNSLYIKGDLDKYFIQIMRFQYKSNSSSFYKEYVNMGFWNKDFINLFQNISQFEDSFYEVDEISKEVENNSLIKLIDGILVGSNPINRELFYKKYYEDKSYKEIAEYYGLSYQVVRLRVKSVRDYLIKTIKKYK